MNYSIGEVAKITNLSTYTLRYYEKEGLLSNVKRGENGLRIFTKDNLERLNVIDCLKATGMSINDIKNYIELFDGGKNTIEARANLFKKQREEIIKQIDSLNNHLATLDYKVWYYENIEALGDESDPLNCEKMRNIYNNLND